MKFLLVTTLAFSFSAFAYNSNTVGNEPVKEEMPDHEKRKIASEDVKKKDLKKERDLNIKK